MASMLTQSQTTGLSVGPSQVKVNVTPSGTLQDLRYHQKDSSLLSDILRNAQCHIKKKSQLTKCKQNTKIKCILVNRFFFLTRFVTNNVENCKQRNEFFRRFIVRIYVHILSLRSKSTTPYNFITVYYPVSSIVFEITSMFLNFIARRKC